MPIPEVEFRSKDKDGNEIHEYWLDGIQIPSVSHILANTGIVNYDGISEDRLENARELGLDIHLACQLYDENDLDEDSLDERVRARLNGWIKFRQETDFKPVAIERPMSWSFMGMTYGMTIDRFGLSKLGQCVIDIKCTAKIEDSHGIQLAGYIQPFKFEGGTVGRYICQLVDDGYKLHEYKDPRDERIFAAALALTYWKWTRGRKA